MEGLCAIERFDLIIVIIVVVMRRHFRMPGSGSNSSLLLFLGQQLGLLFTTQLFLLLDDFLIKHGAVVGNRVSAHRFRIRDGMEILIQNNETTDRDGGRGRQGRHVNNGCTPTHLTLSSTLILMIFGHTGSSSEL
jgi:hypothetical protein